MRRFLVLCLAALLSSLPVHAKAAREDDPEASGQIEVQAEWGPGKSQPRMGFEAEALVPLAGPDSGVVLRAEGEGRPDDEAAIRGLAGWQLALAKGMTLDLLAGIDGLTSGRLGNRVLLRWGALANFQAKVDGFRLESSALALGGRDTLRKGADVADLEAKGEVTGRWPLSGRWAVAPGAAAKVEWSAGLEPAAWSTKQELFCDLHWGSRASSRWSPVTFQDGVWGWAGEVQVGPSEANLRFTVSGVWGQGLGKAELRWKEKF